MKHARHQQRRIGVALAINVIALALLAVTLPAGAATPTVPRSADATAASSPYRALFEIRF